MKVLALVGATGSGKSAFALAMARTLGAEIISVDSMQVYKSMDVGTAKPTIEERADVPHHVLDMVWPNEPYSAGRYCADAHAAIAGVHARGRVPLLVGGTGLYLRAVVYGFADLPDTQLEVRSELRAREAAHPGAAYQELLQCDPATAAVVHPNDAPRIERALEVWRVSGQPLSALRTAHAGGTPRYTMRGVWFRPDRAWLQESIVARTQRMWSNGLLDETQALLDRGWGMTRPLQGIGYLQAAQFLHGRSTRDEAVAQHIVATMQYAKRQRIWFQKGTNLEPIDPATWTVADALRWADSALRAPGDSV